MASRSRAILSGTTQEQHTYGAFERGRGIQQRAKERCICNWVRNFGGKQVLLTVHFFDGIVEFVGGSVNQLDRDRSARQVAAGLSDEEKVIPWAEGNGLWSIISTLASDLVGVDIITFFVQNPYVCDSVESVAVRIGRRVASVKVVLDGLAEAGFLDTMDVGPTRIYNLTDEPNRRQTLQQYVAWLQESYHWGRLVLDNDVNSGES
jgi:hypothetical protein